ncbi:unnamed protein product, partial [Meganyctiphanes norvegica]
MSFISHREKNFVERNSINLKNDKSYLSTDNSILIPSVILIISTTVIAALIQLWMIFPTGKKGIRFYYQTSNNTSRQELTSRDAAPISSSTNVTVIIHGFLESSKSEWIKTLTTALLNPEYGSDQVIILVDYWDVMFAPRLQLRSYIAKETADLLDYFALHKQLNLSQSHLIGFSFGGNILGIVTHHITEGTLGRVTGIDPGDDFKMSEEEFDPSYYLDESDADIVTTIRCSSIGDTYPATSIDFYPNGGLIQPGCDKWYMPKFVQNLCSHVRAPYLMIEAYEQSNSISFEGCSCDDYESYINKTCPCKTKNNFGISINPRFM